MDEVMQAIEAQLTEVAEEWNRYVLAGVEGRNLETGAALSQVMVTTTGLVAVLKGLTRRVQQLSDAVGVSSTLTTDT